MSLARSRMEMPASERPPIATSPARGARMPSSLEQCGIAAAVRAEQRQDLTPLQRDVEAATDHAIAVADGEVAAGKAHDQVRCIPASSQMKNGVPMTAVRIPSGISTEAAVRASVSMKRR